jgi:hypothetical protein
MGAPRLEKSQRSRPPADQAHGIRLNFSSSFRKDFSHSSRCGAFFHSVPSTPSCCIRPPRRARRGVASKSESECRSRPDQIVAPAPAAQKRPLRHPLPGHLPEARRSFRGGVGQRCVELMYNGDTSNAGHRGVLRRTRPHSDQRLSGTASTIDEHGSTSIPLHGLFGIHSDLLG